MLDGGASDGLFIKAAGPPERRVDDQVQSIAFDQVEGVGPALIHLVHSLNLQALLAQSLRGTPCRYKVET